MKEKISIIFTIFVTAVVLVIIGGMTSLNSDDQNLYFSDVVTVSGGKIVSQKTEPIHFDPVGKKCEFEISESGPDDILSKINIYTGDPLTVALSEPMYSTTCTNAKIDTGVLDVCDQNIYVEIEPTLVSDAKIEDGEWNISYRFTLHTDDVSKFDFIMPLVITVGLIIFAVYISFVLNKVNDSEYDEMQMKMRGKCGMSAFMIMVICLLGFAFMSKGNDRFPFTVYEVGIITAMVGCISFAILCDINDAFVGIKQKRKGFVILFIVLAIVSFLSSGLISLGLGYANDMSKIAIVNAFLFIIFALELIIKSNIEKKNKERDDEDEES